MWEYTEEVIKNFLQPKNIGEIKNPDGEATVGSLVCGDFIKLSFKLDKNGIIKNAKFKTFGCASAIASSSVLTEIIKGKTIEDAEKITNECIIKKLGGLPKQKIHCSVMCEEVLQEAIKNYREKHNLIKNNKKDEIICNCLNIRKNQIVSIINKNKLKNIEEITKKCKVGSICGKCKEKLNEILINLKK